MNASFNVSEPPVSRASLTRDNVPLSRVRNSKVTELPPIGPLPEPAQARKTVEKALGKPPVASAPPTARRAEDLEQLAAVLERGASSRNTVRAYAADWKHFETWCAERELASLPATPDTLRHYLADHTDTHRAVTLERRLTAIRRFHVEAALETPTADKMVRQVLAGIRRHQADEGWGTEAKSAFEYRDLVAYLDGIPHNNNLKAARDRAMLLIGFGSGLRRANLSALNFRDVTVTADGLIVNVRRSKTDQDGRGFKIGIPTGTDPAHCPVVAYKAWLAAASITKGPIFRRVDRHGNIGKARLHPDSVNEIVKAAAEQVGLDPGDFGAHSLRIGLVTSAAKAGLGERLIAKQTGHKSMKMVRRYIRDAELFQNNAARAAGL